MAEARSSSAHLILNPAAGSAAALLGRLTETARERGIRVRVLETGEDARLVVPAAGGDGSVAASGAMAALLVRVKVEVDRTDQKTKDALQRLLLWSASVRSAILHIIAGKRRGYFTLAARRWPESS